MMDYRNNYNNENETNNENMMAAEQNSFNGKKPSSKNKKAAKLAKKIGATALSAVLFGAPWTRTSSTPSPTTAPSTVRSSTAGSALRSRAAS